MAVLAGRGSRLRALLTCCAGLLLGAAAVGAQSDFYSWTDDKGTVHFSNSGPPKVGAENLTRRVMRAPTPRSVVRQSDEIPYVILGNNDSQRFVPVVLEGARRRREVLMLIDTGAQLTMIDEELAAELDLEHVQDLNIVGVGGVAEGWLGRLRSLRLGNAEVPGLHVMVGPRTGLRLLGMDVLSALRLTIGPNALHQEE